MGRRPLWIKKMAQVKWDFCCYLKAKGGLGILNVSKLADRLATKWILRGLMQPNHAWVWLLYKNIQHFHIKGNHKWKGLLLSTIIASKYEITTKGSELAISLWKTWSKIKGCLKLSPKVKVVMGFHDMDSIRWPTLKIPQVEIHDLEEARKLHRMNIKSWGGPLGR